MTERPKMILGGKAPKGVMKAAPEDLDPEETEVEGMKIMMMATLADMGVTPEDYAEFLSDKDAVSKIREELFSMADEFGFDTGRHREAEPVHALPHADSKSLRIKVQMKGVTKPPMWREIVIPADFSFSQLHHAIQAVTGLENSHLWMFQHKAYDRVMKISIPDDEDLWSGGEVTYDADKTPVTGFLKDKGDKLEYVYDFGDDWIFTVSVQEVTDRQGDVAECTKWKCDFNAIEDCGGVWAYLTLRDLYASPGDFTAREKAEQAAGYGFESFARMKAWLEDAVFDPELVNARLASLPDSAGRPF